MTMTTMTTATPLLIDQINSLKTQAKYYLAGLHHEMSNMIEVPNSLLPEKLRGKTGRSCAELMAPPKMTTREIAKLEAEEREIRFHEDEERLYRNQITFANLIGMEFED